MSVCSQVEICGTRQGKESGFKRPLTALHHQQHHSTTSQLLLLHRTNDAWLGPNLLALAIDGLHFLGAEFFDGGVPAIEEGEELLLVPLQEA